MVTGPRPHCVVESGLTVASVTHTDLCICFRLSHMKEASEGSNTVGGRADLRGRGLASGHQAHQSPCGPLHSVSAAPASSPLHKQPLFISLACCRGFLALNSASDQACTSVFVCLCVHPYICQSNYVQSELRLIIQ